MTATAKKQKPLKRHPSKLKKMSAYMILTLILISHHLTPERKAQFDRVYAMEAAR